MLLRHRTIDQHHGVCSRIAIHLSAVRGNGRHGGRRGKDVDDEVQEPGGSHVVRGDRAEDGKELPIKHRRTQSLPHLVLA